MISQYRNGEKFNPMKALGSGLRGGVEFGVKGALMSANGVSKAVKFLGDFAAGTIGSALEQGTGGGKVNLGESLWGGLTNAVSGRAYGYKPIKSAGGAFGRGFAGGAVTSLMNDTHDILGIGDAGGGRRTAAGAAIAGAGASVIAGNAGRSRDPRGMCETGDAFSGGIGSQRGRGYQHGGRGRSRSNSGGSGFSFGNMLRNALIGGLVGGLTGTAFYGMDRAVERVSRSVARRRSNTEYKPNQGQGFSDRGYNPRPGERTLNGYVRQNANPEIALYTNSARFNNSKGISGGQFKRIGAEEHYGLSPHVHQPIRNIAPNGIIYGRTGKTVGVDTLYPSSKDVKQLYEHLNNGKY